MIAPQDRPSDTATTPRRRQVSGSTLFLEHANYRQRRLRDVLRMLPVLGVVLVMIPLLWRRDATLVEEVPTTASGGTADAVLFIFVAWALLIALSAVITSRMKPDADDVLDDET